MTKQNFARGNLDDGKGMLILFDSGASRSIISESTVVNSQYLRSREVTKVDPILFKLGNGQRIRADTKIDFMINIQGHPFHLNAFVAPELIGVEVILGTETLKELQGVLDFSNNCFSTLR